ncbi:PKD-like domain-containing protein [Saccharicrinis carchari]|uniref:PKD-like domain-containing protein n=1 Tax=Saccharicrinis carchari TaxID=1168039 RepID=A0A521C6L7_SACCC|nr:PKD-like domain-containing protein [Saccharicrinis carchari]SMO55054.1 PKD-like domain-containing protein [Saccharicrinis carchari]
MKNYIFLLLLLFFAYSCAKDDSSLLYPVDNPDFSFISISSPTDSLSVDFGQEFEFTPEVTQKIKGKSLVYEWSACLKKDGVKNDSIVIGHTQTLQYAFEKMGTYDLRLEVKNEDYSEFYTWHVDVRVYDEGYMVVGMNEAGQANIAFARILSSTDVLEGKELTFVSDLIGKVNPEFDIRDVIHVRKSILAWGSSDAYLFIFCKDNIYIADPLTFEIFAAVDVGGTIPGARISKVSIMDTYTTGGTIFTEDGRNLSFQKLEMLLYESVNISGTYDGFYGNLFYTRGSNMDLAYVNVDYQASKIWTTIFYHAGSMPVNNTTNNVEPYEDDFRPNDYAGRDIVTVGRMNGDYFGGTNTNFWAIATDKTNAKDVKIVEFGADYAAGISTINAYEYVADEEITLPMHTELIANARYASMYYSKGGEIFIWYPGNIPPHNHLPKTAAITLDGNKEVTCMSVSYDMRELYVGVYDSDATGDLKGSLYIYNCADIGSAANLQPTRKFENITSRPVQVLYKPEAWGIYNSGD